MSLPATVPQVLFVGIPFVPGLVRKFLKPSAVLDPYVRVLNSRDMNDGVNSTGFSEVACYGAIFVASRIQSNFHVGLAVHWCPVHLDFIVSGSSCAIGNKVLLIRRGRPWVWWWRNYGHRLGQRESKQLFQLPFPSHKSSTLKMIFNLLITLIQVCFNFCHEEVNICRRVRPRDAQAYFTKQGFLLQDELSAHKFDSNHSAFWNVHGVPRPWHIRVRDRDASS